MDEHCQAACDSIKAYLATSAVLASPLIGEPLVLYIAAFELSFGALLAQKNAERKENPLYYLSRTLVDPED